MGRKLIEENVKRRLYAESMGKCMNPACQKNLFIVGGDIIEKAHIHPYCETVDNSFENLIILCPNCHTEFDKGTVFSSAEMKEWKKTRKEQLEIFFSEKFKTFDEMKEKIKPLLLENKNIYENYFLGDKKVLWDKFENKILVNNEKLKGILKNNLNLLQSSTNYHSNLDCVLSFLEHIEEFKVTRGDKEKIRGVLFPENINSIFGITPVKGHMSSSTESLEAFLYVTDSDVELGIENPYILLGDDKIFLDDTPRLSQLYYNNRCFRETVVNLKSLNFALKYIKTRRGPFEYKNFPNLREIIINGVTIIFVYEYCLSKAFLMNLCPEKDSVIVNLHNWNGESCISGEAYNFSKTLDIVLLTLDNFYGYIREVNNVR
ncbi:HNH endonuclease signature motif containing protein [Fusobacterium varium]|uniref:HNH endonuclease signature motif containing protein n=1 Tax=Fusobacterium varium TaxID=856 RepID=UPI000E3FDB78|nr:HNH endonuclease signature motif containing protein [Fusobacterium varium]RGJ28622.1 HNH endonuclease [Fusobacterium varium]